MLLIRVIIFSSVLLASLIVFISLLASLAGPEFQRLKQFTETNCTVITKKQERIFHLKKDNIFL